MDINNTKLKLLYLADIFYDETDEENFLSTCELIEKLSRYGISVSRKTLYEDIEVLKFYGLDIVIEQHPGKSNMYALASREFETAELKVLIDCINYSKFLTKKKSDELIKKLGTLACRKQAKKLSRQLITNESFKASNESIYYNIDSIYTAIAENRQISFRYFDRTSNKGRQYRNDGKKYLVSPYSLVLSNNNYYLIAYYEKYDGLSQFRVDRMDSVETVNEPRIKPEIAKNLSSYTQKLFSMYSGNTSRVEILFDKDLTNAALDKFGRECIITNVDDRCFKVCADVSISPAFFAWLFKFGNKAKLVSPQEVIAELKQYTEEFLSCYQ